ncbi:MAG: hypothetical protein ABIN37_11630 [Burkholderiaceae bacterium]
MKILRVLVVLVLLVAVGTWLVLRLPAFGDLPEGERLQKMERLPQFRSGAAGEQSGVSERLGPDPDDAQLFSGATA